MDQHFEIISDLLAKRDSTDTKIKVEVTYANQGAVRGPQG